MNKELSAVFTKKVFLILIFKAFKKQQWRSSLPSFTFDLIFLHYLHSAYHNNRGFFYSFSRQNLPLPGGTITDILLLASAFAFFELFGTLLELDKFFLLYEIMFFVESHDTSLTIETSDELSVVTFEIFVSSLSSYSYPLLKSSSFSSLVGFDSLTIFSFLFF